MKNGEEMRWRIKQRAYLSEKFDPLSPQCRAAW